MTTKKKKQNRMTTEGRSFLRVISDGTPTGTKILDDKNNVVQNVKAFVIRGDAGSLVTLELTIHEVECDVQGVEEPSSPSSSSMAPDPGSLIRVTPGQDGTLQLKEPLAIQVVRVLNPRGFEITVCQGLHEDKYTISEHAFYGAAIRGSGNTTSIPFHNSDRSLTRFVVKGTQLLLTMYRGQPCNVEIR